MKNKKLQLKIQKFLTQKKLFLILFLVFLIHLFFRIYSYGNEYLLRFDPVYWEKRYELSQWSPKEACRNLDPHVNPETCQWDDGWYAENKNADESVLKKTSLGDDGLYTYAGWKYIHGNDPTLLNAEIPPFGKYLIGLSILIFGNQNIFALLSGIFVLIAFFVLNKIIFKNNLFAFLPVFIFSFDPLFYTQLKAPFLDLLYLGFLILIFIFFLKEKILWSMIFLGFMMATKASASTLFLVATSMFLYLIYTKRMDLIKKSILLSPVSVVIFLFSYIVFFLHGNTFIDFLKAQKWILNFYATGAKGDIGAVFQILFTGNWPTWWGQIVKISEWSLLWPLSLMATFFYIYIVIRKRKIYKSALFAIWILVYLVFLMFVPVWPRYLLLALPFMYTLFVWVFLKKNHWFSSD